MRARGHLLIDQCGYGWSMIRVASLCQALTCLELGRRVSLVEMQRKATACSVRNPTDKTFKFLHSLHRIANSQAWPTIGLVFSTEQYVRRRLDQRLGQIK